MIVNASKEEFDKSHLKYDANLKNLERTDGSCEFCNNIFMVIKRFFYQLFRLKTIYLSTIFFTMLLSSCYLKYVYLQHNKDIVGLEILGSLPLEARNVYVDGDYAYTTRRSGIDTWAGIDIIDITSEDNPKKVGYLNYPGASRIWVCGDFAYICKLDYSATRHNGLCIINIKDKKNPKVAGFLKMPYISNMNTLCVFNGYAYIACVWDGLRIIDVSNPCSPKEVCVYDPEDFRIFDLSISGNYAYLAAYEHGFRILDIQDVTDPKEIGIFVANPALTYYPVNVSVYGDFAYVQCISGLLVLDISSKSSPKNIGAFDAPYYGIYARIIASERYLYINSSRGLMVLNVDNKRYISEVAYYDPREYGDVRGISLKGDYIYLVGHGRFLILKKLTTASNKAIP